MSDLIQRPAMLSSVPIIPLHENPLFDEWLAAVEEYRNARDAEERAAGERTMEVSDLEYWASLGRLERVTEALRANPDINVCGADGYTAMHAAAENGHLDVIRFLADHGGDLSPRTAAGETPLDLAQSARQFAAVELLRSLGAKQ